jgi:hypothetical protein
VDATGVDNGKIFDEGSRERTGTAIMAKLHFETEAMQSLVSEVGTVPMLKLVSSEQA